jgi:hypothetical protein
MTSFCLLIFSFNSNDGVMHLVRTMKESVDEIVIVDSSDTDVYMSLCRSVGDRASVYRTIPLGTTDLYRSYASSKIRSDYVLNLDCDEDVTPRFISDFRRFDEASAYLVGWYHVKLQEMAKKLILYRNGCVTWMGHVFETPKVSGTTADISSSYHILHHAEVGSGYLNQHGRNDRYFFYESIGRPFTWGTFLRSFNLHPRSGSPGSGISQELLRSSYLWRLLILGAYVERVVRQPGQRKIARFLLHYGLERLSYFSNLNVEQQKLFVSISNSVYEYGGLIHYLRLDDPDYLDRLTGTFDWSMGSSGVARRLIMFRHLHGRPLPSFREMPYSEREVDDFWSGQFERRT